MFERKSFQEIQDLLSWSPAVAILGARQIGKTTLAKLIAKTFQKSIYLDLENAQALSKASTTRCFFSNPSPSIGGT